MSTTYYIVVICCHTVALISLSITHSDLMGITHAHPIFECILITLSFSLQYKKNHNGDIFLHICIFPIVLLYN